MMVGSALLSLQSKKVLSSPFRVIPGLFCSCLEVAIVKVGVV